ncbi:MAG: hypothetical protein ACTSR9_15510 [Candidatus Thorarchaeota archaeon]
MNIGIGHLSKKKHLLSFVVLLSFAIDILQIIPFATTSSMYEISSNVAEVGVDGHDDVSIIEELEIQDPISTHQIALDPPVQDYVDTHYYDGYGSTSNFAYMQNP